MSLEVALKSIEFLKEHSSQSDFVSIGFYGGEPLMEFPLIKKCVKYAGEIIHSQNLLFTITTNATLISPTIGNVRTGFDFEAIKKVYIDDYAESSLEDCAHCWGLRLCDVCYAAAFGENGKFDLNKKRKSCNSGLRSLEKLLGYFVTLMEEKPGGLDYLYRYELQ